MKTQEQIEAAAAFASVKNHPLDQYWIDQMNKQIEEATAELRAVINEIAYYAKDHPEPGYECVLCVIEALAQGELQPCGSDHQESEATAELRVENERLRGENLTFRNAMKACEECDAVTMEEVKQLRAERERIVAEIEAKLISSSLPDAYEEGFDDGLKAAIEIVNGDDGRG